VPYVWAKFHAMLLKRPTLFDKMVNREQPAEAAHARL
jgi:hypothetical protein